MAIINIENASLKTLSVQIKTLSVGNKQVTLSLFRQIIEEDLIDYYSLKLNGIPWGIVNYFWKEDYEDLKLHILWQKGGELRRCVILRNAYHYRCSIKTYSEYENDLEVIKEEAYPHSAKNETYRYPDINIEYLTYQIKQKEKDLEKAINWDEKDEDALPYSYRSDEKELKKYEDLLSRDSARDDCRNSIKRLEEKRINGTFTTTAQMKEKHINDLTDEIKELKIKLRNSIDEHERLRKDYTEIKNKLDALVSGYDSLIKSLLDLPHLFIAV